MLAISGTLILSISHQSVLATFKSTLSSASKKSPLSLVSYSCWRIFSCCALSSRSFLSLSSSSLACSSILSFSNCFFAFWKPSTLGNFVVRVLRSLSATSGFFFLSSSNGNAKAAFKSFCSNRSSLKSLSSVLYAFSASRVAFFQYVWEFLQSCFPSIPGKICSSSRSLHVTLTSLLTSGALLYFKSFLTVSALFKDSVTLMIFPLRSGN